MKNQIFKVGDTVVLNNKARRYGTLTMSGKIQSFETLGEITPDSVVIVKFEDGYYDTFRIKELSLSKNSITANMTPEEMVLLKMREFSKLRVSIKKRNAKQNLVTTERTLDAYETELRNLKERKKNLDNIINSKSKKLTDKIVKERLENLKKIEGVNQIYLKFEKNENTNLQEPILYITTKPITIQKIDTLISSANINEIKKEKKIYKIDAGSYNIRINFKSSNTSLMSYQRITIFNNDIKEFNQKQDFGLRHHPHIQDYGSCCFGEYQELIEMELEHLNFENLIIGLLEYLGSYNEHSCYIQFYQFNNARTLASYFKDKQFKIGKYDRNKSFFRDAVYQAMDDISFKKKELNLSEINKLILDRLKHLEKYDSNNSSNDENEENEDEEIDENYEDEEEEE